MAQRLVPKMALTVVRVVGEVIPVPLPVMVIHLLGLPRRAMTVALTMLTHTLLAVAVGGPLGRMLPVLVTEAMVRGLSGVLKPPMTQMWFITLVVVPVVATPGVQCLVASVVVVKGEAAVVLRRRTLFQTRGVAVVVPVMRADHRMPVVRERRVSSSSGMR